MGKPVLVIGAGAAGLTAALDLAEAGAEVILIEKDFFVGGRVSHMRHYFPKLCPPACGLEIHFKRLRRHPRVTVLTGATLEKLTGAPGDFQASVRLRPRHVSADCTGCGECLPKCPANAIGIAQPVPFPPVYAIERGRCPADCKACVEACRYGAIDLAETERRETFAVASAVAATGWKPYDAARLPLGFGRFPNVVTNVMVEEGALVRPSDGKPPKTVAFAQCAGSRDENHLSYCSAVCCAATLKQSTYFEGARVTVFYIDIRTMGRLEDFYTRIAPSVELVKGKIGKVEEDPATHDLLITAEDVMAGKKTTRRVEMLVLATGLVPQAPPGFTVDEFGFAQDAPGMYAAGCARRPGEVSASSQSATAAALKALRWAVRNG
ncbi:MAG: FAD-dependent oxidoreductase [Acidobacteria bacterium]|nr:FAD-dependent oxidoreductase [Acidobacteriota bacterium]